MEALKPTTAIGEDLGGDGKVSDDAVNCGNIGSVSVDTPLLQLAFQIVRFLLASVFSDIIDDIDSNNSPLPVPNRHVVHEGFCGFDGHYCPADALQTAAFL